MCFTAKTYIFYIAPGCLQELLRLYKNQAVLNNLESYFSFYIY
nr:MAG TPA: hypothetical protein [Crassvirales sp.]